MSRAAAHRFAALVLLSPSLGCRDDCPRWEHEPLDDGVRRIVSHTGISESGDIYYARPGAHPEDLSFNFESYTNLGSPLYGLSNTHSVLAAVGRQGAIFVSTEPHTTWKRAEAPPVQEDLLAVNLSCATPPLALAVGRGGRILRSTSSGETWELADSSTQQDLHGLSIGPGGEDDVAVVVGAGGTILRSTDAGITWAAVESSATEDLFWVDFPTQCKTSSLYARGYAVGRRGTVLVSTNAGASWEPLDLGIPDDLRQVHLDGHGAKFLGEGRLWHWFPNYKEAWVLHDFGQVIDWYDDDPNRPKAGGEGTLFWYRGFSRCPGAN